MKDFVAIDFETANFEQSSICSMGIVIVKDGELVDNFYSLVRPIPNYYNETCSSVNGMCYDLENHHHALADAEACAWIAREIV